MQVSTLTMQLTQASMQLRSLQQDTSSLGSPMQSSCSLNVVLHEHCCALSTIGLSCCLAQLHTHGSAAGTAAVPAVSSGHAPQSAGARSLGIHHRVCTFAGECNQALAQQALVLREHMAQRDAETAALVSELQSARVPPPLQP